MISSKTFLKTLAILTLAFTVFACSGPATVGKDTALITDSVMVVTAHPEATRIGVEILRAGGNAIDAAVATEFALAVCYPGAGNIAGGGFMVIRTPEGEYDAIDYREKAPALAYENMFLDENGEPIPGMSLSTHLAAGVPGTVKGLWNAHIKYGKLSWRLVVEPAIIMAAEGFAVTERQASSLNALREKFVSLNKGKVAFVKENPWVEGDLLTQPELAETLGLIRDNGTDGFYAGITADRIVSEMKRGEGLISYSDLLEYTAEWRNPVEGFYKGYRVVSMPPPSSGGVALLQLLASVEDYDIRSMKVNTPSSVHLMSEAEKRVYADRAEYLGDSDFVSVPVAGLINPDYSRERMTDYSPDKSTPSEFVGSGSPFGSKESEETTHYSIVDRNRMAVSGTTTLNGSYGTCIVVEGAGFILNNQMDDFSIKQGSPNMYGLVGGHANAIEPGKRMLSSMTPTIVDIEGKLFMVVGSPGGSTIITSVFQTIVNVIDHGMNMQQAVNTLRFHHQWLPDYISFEEGAFSMETINRLENLGHTLKMRESIGRVDAIRVMKDGRLEGGADPRGDDKAAGF